ncbi:MAG: hypothetical protein IPJ98_28625 [Bryobacterales bacterium]|nr:hypothetical protein [Bryobacterales bacterium]
MVIPAAPAASTRKKADTMTHPGTILVAPGTPLPDCLQIEPGASNAHSWLLANPTHPSPRFEQELQDSGWTFFCLADTISAISINFNTAQAGQAAMKRLIAKAAARHCNALQVDQIAAHFFLGIPYLRVSAHPRHIQRGMVFPRPLRAAPNSPPALSPSVAAPPWRAK